MNKDARTHLDQVDLAIRRAWEVTREGHPEWDETEMYFVSAEADGQYVVVVIGYANVDDSTVEVDTTDLLEKNVELPIELIREAMTTLVPYLAKSHTDRTNSYTTSDYSESFIWELVTELWAGAEEEDRSVGIFGNAAGELAAELLLRLDGKMTCPTCSGEGFTWDEQIFQGDAAAYAEEEGVGIEEARRLCEDSGYVTCWRCGGARIVQAEV